MILDRLARAFLQVYTTSVLDLLYQGTLSGYVPAIVLHIHASNASYTTTMLTVAAATILPYLPALP